YCVRRQSPCVPCGESRARSRARGCEPAAHRSAVRRGEHAGHGGGNDDLHVMTLRCTPRHLKWEIHTWSCRGIPDSMYTVSRLKRTLESELLPVFTLTAA